MQSKSPKLNWKMSNKGQSFVELTLVFVILLILFVGMVEFGNLLNQYINLVDGTREGARFASTDDPFGSGNYAAFFGKIYDLVEGRPGVGANGKRLDKGAIAPLVLDPTRDDIVASVFSITSNAAANSVSVVRFSDPAGSRYQNKTSSFSTDQIKTLLDPLAPSSGIVLVEVFFAYNQVTKMFSFTGIPDPIYVHTYSIMPLSAAEPTATPKPPVSP